MVLRITNSEEDFGITVHKISLANFAQKEYHPMLAVTKWDKVYIDLCEETPRGIIKQLLRKCQIIPVFDRENVTPRVLQLLCEIIPDESAKLRQSFMKGQDIFKACLDEMEVKYWRT